MSFALQIPKDYYDFARMNLPVEDNYLWFAKLIHEAINGLEKKVEFELFDEVFHYGLGEFEAGTRYGLNFHLNTQVCVVFSTQRDIAYPLAVFPLVNSHAAAKYFVWLVSKGKCEINW